MNIALDCSPLNKQNYLQHRVRGTGFYIESLKKSLLQFFPQHNYVFFDSGEKLPQDIDVVHYPYFEPFFLSLPYRKNCKNIVTVHDLTPLVFPKYFPIGIKGNIKWYFQKRTLQKMDGILTDSLCSKRDIIKYAGISEEKIHVVYLAVDESFKKIKDNDRKQQIRKKYNLPDKFLLYVGDVTWNKNLPNLLEAIKKINIPLVMIGKALLEPHFDRKNPWNQDLLKVQRLAEGNRNIIRLGFVPTEDLVFFYNIATLFVMPSFYEGFGLPILEAMSCGCPVITTKNGSLSEIADDAVYYVNAHEIDSIAIGIKDVFENDDIQKLLSKKGQQQAKMFSWKKTAQATIEVYEKNN